MGVKGATFTHLSDFTRGEVEIGEISPPFAPTAPWTSRTPTSSTCVWRWLLPRAGGGLSVRVGLIPSLSHPLRSGCGGAWKRLRGAGPTGPAFLVPAFPSCISRKTGDDPSAAAGSACTLCRTGSTAQRQQSTTTIKQVSNALSSREPRADHQTPRSFRSQRPHPSKRGHGALPSRMEHTPT